MRALRIMQFRRFAYICPTWNRHQRNGISTLSRICHFRWRTIPTFNRSRVCRRWIETTAHDMIELFFFCAANSFSSRNRNEELMKQKRKKLDDLPMVVRKLPARLMSYSTGSVTMLNSLKKKFQNISPQDGPWVRMKQQTIAHTVTVTFLSCRRWIAPSLDLKEELCDLF